MKVFKKDIELDNDKVKQLLLIGIGVITLLLVLFFVVLPVKQIYSKKAELRRAEEKDIKLIGEVKKSEILYEEYLINEKENQKEEEEVIKGITNSDYNSAAEINQMVFDILNFLNIKLLEIGNVSSEKSEDGEKLEETIHTQYIKKTIPYKILGEEKNIILFFYYLENAKTFITTTTAGVEIEVINSTDENEKDNMIEVIFNIGYYKDNYEGY